ncbi:MEMBRANE-ASSOCIATED KINASE REGULATOR 6 [Hibiscus trionum]|uniref:MEMBRANE-ASSOCIATED KINASE REGULATOR 6 n=1 Tax=Hibiscus trionum TaxID=183268 RepID=A0A9W7IRS4_HIBTR|nr:MEMBRANE-ASSOCIATED KINASE REGULATOR 6 [Hibiscus trionum]
METPQSLAIESFSYSWLSQDEPPRTSIDIQEFSYVTDQNFKFDGIAPTAPAAFIHADELFTNGFIKPVYVDASKEELCNTFNSIRTMPPSSPFSSTVEIRKERNHCSFLRRCGNSTKRMLRNLYGNLRPLVGFLRKSSRVDDVDRRTWKVKSSPRASPQRSTTARSVGDSTCHLENSIYEAVLHCKRSIEK